MLQGAASSPAGAAGEHPVLEAQVQIAHALEHAAKLERPGDGVRAAEEIAHLHGVTNDPRSENGNSETLAGARTMVGQDLGEGESSLDSKTDGAQEANIGLGIGNWGEVEDKQDGNEVGEEKPVPMVDRVRLFGRKIMGEQIDLRLGVLPLPEIVGPVESTL